MSGLEWTVPQSILRVPTHLISCSDSQAVDNHHAAQSLRIVTAPFTLLSHTVGPGWTRGIPTDTAQSGACLSDCI